MIFFRIARRARKRNPKRRGSPHSKCPPAGGEIPGRNAMSKTTALMLALVLALPASAAEKFDPEARARAVAPFLDEQTFLVAHVDLTRIDPDALRKQLA